MKKKDLALAAALLLAIVIICCWVLLGGALPGDEQDTVEGKYSITINEICTKNDSIIADNDGKFRDYIELYNGGEAVSLEGFSLNDGKVSCAPFGSMTLESGEYLLVFLGRETTGFALGASGGDCVQLLDSNGAIVVQATTAALLTDQVMLYRGGIYENSYDASPGFENSAAGVSAFRKGDKNSAPELVISEILIGNSFSLADENGVYSDVIELYNSGADTLNLRHYCLSDDREMRFAFRLPDTELAPGQAVSVYCDGENRIGPRGEIHANFALSHGEELVLTDSEGRYTAVTAEYMGDDISQILDENGEYIAGAVSLGFENSEDGALRFAGESINADSPLVISEVLLSSAGVPYMGLFQDAVEIVNRSGGEVSTEGWYLSDGGDPYEYPLPSGKLQPGEYLVIPCTPQTTGFSLAEGETVYLTAPDYRRALPVKCAAGETGKSISLCFSETMDSYTFGEVSLGFANTEEGHAEFVRPADELVISELMSANQSYLRGPYAVTADWIELYNASSRTLELSDYCISDRSGDAERWNLPEKQLAPGEYCVIFLKSDPTNLDSRFHVLPFSLSSSGEQIYLSQEGRVVDYVFLPALSADEAYGRADGSMLFSLLKTPTPGTRNSGAAEKSSMPAALTAQGCYDGVEYLDVVLEGEGDIYYTTNAYFPGDNAELYTGPIRITETTVIRAVCREIGKTDSEVLNLSYLINENDTLPVVSVVTDPANLWDYGIGIYVVGPNAEEEFPFFGANFWNDWERLANVSLFETDGSGFSENCGLKIFGGFTVTMAKKSLSCNFRDVYGCSELRYPLFGEDSFDTYEAFILRTTGQDAIRARMRDVVITSLFSEYIDVPVQDYKPVIVYLNGEYWGLHYIREKINSNYLAAHYASEPDSLKVVKYGGWTCPEYIDFAKYVAEHDMTVAEHYDYACSKMDVDNYIDWIIAEMWTANEDHGNVKYFLSPEGKWTWILYDTDMALTNYRLNSFDHYLSYVGMGGEDTSCKTFVAKMIKNEEFRDKFLRRFAWQMNTVWTEENLHARVDEICALIDADMPRECERWDDSYESWLENVEEIRLFINERSGYMLQYIQEEFGLSNKEMREYGFDV